VFAISYNFLNILLNYYIFIYNSNKYFIKILNLKIKALLIIYFLYLLYTLINKINIAALKLLKFYIIKNRFFIYLTG